MDLTSRSEYAIHGLYYLTMQEPGTATYVSEIARSQGVSESYLAKIFQSLAKNGLVTSFRGTKGGYALSRNPVDITLRQIVEAVEGSSPIFNCSGFKEICNLNLQCLIQGKFKEAEDKMFEVLDEVSLMSILDELQGEPIIIDKNSNITLQL